MIAVILCGFACIVAAGFYAPLNRVDIQFLILFCFTVGVGARITVPIPGFKSQISVSDTFIFLTLMLYGGELAILLAAVEAFFSSWRFCSKKITVFFNVAALALSMSAVVGMLQLSGFYADDRLHGYTDQIQSFVVALSIIALTQFVVNTSLCSIHDSLKNELPVWETWKSKYIWTFVTYFVGAAAAGLLVQLFETLGLGMLVAILPVTFFVFLAYRMYLKNVEISMTQAEQAEQYAKRLEEQSSALQESEERFRSAFTYAPIGIALVSSNGQWLKVNRALSQILGYSEEEFLTMDVQAVIFPEDLGVTLIRIQEVADRKVASCQLEHRYVHKSGHTVWASWSVSSAGDSKSENPNLIIQIQDITDRKSAEERLQYDATHDVLTGLPNRALLTRRLTQALEKSRHDARFRVSMLFIDLDRFKNVNDSLGHVCGDRLLVSISERIRDCMRPSDVVARLGGDEFVILVEGYFDLEEVVGIAVRVQEKFSLPFELNGHEVYSSASIGILNASEKHVTAEDMLRDADTAMYQAKRAGKARHEVFDEKMHKAAKETLRLETDLRHAVERNEYSIHYQPIYSLATGKIEGLEALARWTHPEFGEIPPKRFIDLAEEIGLIHALGQSVMRRACVEFSGLRGAYSAGEDLSLSINLSCRQFAQAGLVDSIRNILVETGFLPRHLKLEITESVFFEYQDKAIEMLNQLRDLGIELNVDDFGTGYSNLSYLARMPISSLKIDRSFVSMFDHTGGSPAIVQTIIMLARNLGLRVVAEGVETQTQLDQLKKLNCDAAQGYFFARPMSFADTLSFLSGDEVSAFDIASATEFSDLPVHSTLQ